MRISDWSSDVCSSDLVNTHDTLLTFTSAGRVFWLPVHQLPDAGPHARGRPIINWLRLEEGEQVQAVLPVREYSEDLFVFFATRNGTVKKRSEEHTSELQSLMRISYAVFCLKQK